MTDNENKMKSAFKNDCISIGCSAHYLNKLLQYVFTNNNTKCDTAQVLFKLVCTFIITNNYSSMSTCLVNYSDTRFSGVYFDV